MTQQEFFFNRNRHFGNTRPCRPLLVAVRRPRWPVNLTSYYCSTVTLALKAPFWAICMEQTDRQKRKPNSVHCDSWLLCAMQICLSLLFSASEVTTLWRYTNLFITLTYLLTWKRTNDSIAPTFIRAPGVHLDPSRLVVCVSPTRQVAPPPLFM